MTETTDRQLLRDAIKWARAAGWRRDHHGPCGGPEPGSRYWVNDRDAVIELDRHNVLRTPISEVDCCDTIHVGLDVLVAVGVLPARFSSAYAAGVVAGRDQAMAGADWGVRYPDGYTVQVVDEHTARAWAADHEPYGTRPGPPVAVWRTAWAEPEQGGQR